MSRKDPSLFLPSEGFIRLPMVLHVLSIGKTSFLTGVREGRFPKPVKLGTRTTAWRVNDIRALIASFDDGNRESVLKGGEKANG